MASLPAQPLDLSIYLPIGSEERVDTMLRFFRLRGIFNSHERLGDLQNRKVTLHLRIDLTGFVPGRYLLGVRKANFRWTYYPLALAK